METFTHIPYPYSPQLQKEKKLPPNCASQGTSGIPGAAQQQTKEEWKREARAKRSHLRELRRKGPDPSGVQGFEERGGGRKGGSQRVARSELNSLQVA